MAKRNLMFLNSKSSIEVGLQLKSPEKEAKCVRNVTLYFQNMNQNQDAALVNITMACKSGKPGKWVLELH
ncbi:hypothetical protein JTE90_019086 [Oedothorax gibbosus]|uniref:Uncharacterized protein n=1 Tax=Oedothorax gibbosus TaxID=931172 RepID=A0AAV6TTT9_9ARAC|nr:hypothetical protein JTE90_019086 [Oedothorax gibbosus]